MRTKQVFNIMAVLALGLTLASCGSDNKGSNVGVNSSGFSLNNQQASATTDSLRSQYPCAYGQANVQSFTVSVGGSTGSNQTFVGVQLHPTYPDIIVVQVNGSQANVQVSMCPLQGGYPIQFVSTPQFTPYFLSQAGAQGTMSFQYTTQNGGYNQASSSFTGKGVY